MAEVAGVSEVTTACQALYTDCRNGRCSSAVDRRSLRPLLDKAGVLAMSASTTPHTLTSRSGSAGACRLRTRWRRDVESKAGSKRHRVCNRYERIASGEERCGDVYRLQAEMRTLETARALGLLAPADRVNVRLTPRDPAGGLTDVIVPKR